jgi:proteasome lid subunit RPN8/RPN11
MQGHGVKSGRPMRVVRIKRRVLYAMARHARTEAPDECCGLLVGRAGRVDRVHPARNRHTQPRRRYLIDPRDHFEAIRDARRRGAEVIGAYHSHPASTVRPSPTNGHYAEAGLLYVIMAPRPGTTTLFRPAFGAYYLVEGNFRPVKLVGVG